MTEQKAKLTWTSVHDGPGKGITHAWDVRAFPTLVLIDQSGVVRFRCEGEPSNGILEQKIEELLRDSIREKTGS